MRPKLAQWGKTRARAVTDWGGFHQSEEPLCPVQSRKDPEILYLVISLASGGLLRA